MNLELAKSENFMGLSTSTMCFPKCPMLELWLLLDRALFSPGPCSVYWPCSANAPIPLRLGLFFVRYLDNKTTKSVVLPRQSPSITGNALTRLLGELLQSMGQATVNG